jgi:hypothetical protein
MGIGWEGEGDQFSFVGGEFAEAMGHPNERVRQADE